METIIIMDAAAKRADLEKKALEKKILEELEKSKWKMQFKKDLKLNWFVFQK